jgi:hypothetical protein
MSTSHIVSLLIEERSRLESAIDALRGGPESGIPDWVSPKASPAPAARKPMSAAARKRIGEATRARWAARRAAVAESVAPKRKTNSVRIAEAIATKEDAEFKARMSAAMRKAWANRKKAKKKTKAV